MKKTIPDMFDSSKYNAIERYGVKEFYRDLSWRVMLLEQLQRDSKAVAHHFEKYKDKLGCFDTFIFDYPLKANTLFAEENIHSDSFFFKNPEYRIFKYETERTRKLKNLALHKESSPIRSITVGELLLYSNSSLFEPSECDIVLDNPHATRLEELWARKNIEGNPLDKPMDIFFGEKQEVFLAVDFSRSNEVLVQQFNDFIINYRKKVIEKRVPHKHSIGIEFSEELLSKLHSQYRVIPYFDLVLWTEYTGQKLKNKEVCELLELKSPEQVRKTIREWFKGVANRTALSGLFGQISQ